LSPDNLNAIKSLNVENLSTGIEALQDKYLGILNRPYDTKQVKAAVERAVNKGFKCFNVDFIFALPNQTYSEIVRWTPSLGQDRGNIKIGFRYP